MSRASILGYITIEVVLDHDDFFATVGVSSEDALNRSVCALALSACNVPSIIIEIIRTNLIRAFQNSCTYAFLIMSSK